MVTRDEYLEQCKQRARKYLDRQEVTNAIASICSDLKKHPDFVGIVDKIMPVGLFYAMTSDYDGAKRFIEGFR